MYTRDTRRRVDDNERNEGRNRMASAYHEFIHTGSNPYALPECLPVCLCPASHAIMPALFLLVLCLQCIPLCSISCMPSCLCSASYYACPYYYYYYYYLLVLVLCLSCMPSMPCPCSALLFSPSFVMRSQKTQTTIHDLVCCIPIACMTYPPLCKAAACLHLIHVVSTHVT